MNEYKTISNMQPTRNHQERIHMIASEGIEKDISCKKKTKANNNNYIQIKYRDKGGHYIMIEEPFARRNNCRKNI